VSMALKILRLSLQDIWQELWTILVVNLLFLVATILVITAPPATLALFYYGNRIVHDEIATERDFLRAIREYWGPAWRWGFINITVIAFLTGDYYLVGRLTENTDLAAFVQGLYVILLAGWLLLQWFTLPFLLEQKEPRVRQAFRNAGLFMSKNFVFVFILALLLILSLMLGTLVFMLTFVFGGAFVAFVGNRAVLSALSET